MSLQDILNKRYGGESSGRDFSSSFQSRIAERYNPLVNYRKQQNERIRKQENFDNAQKQGIQARQDFENVNSSILNRINTFFGRGVSAPGEVKQTFGESPLVKMLAGETTKTYEDVFLQGQKDRVTQSQITRNLEYIKTALRRKKENPQKAEFYDNFIQQRLEENKTLAAQAGGEIAKKTTGQLIGQSLGTAVELAQLIPGSSGYTTAGRQALKSATGKGILQGSKLFSKQGAKNLLTNPAVVENSLYGGVMETGQGLQEQKGTLGTIGSGVAGTAFGGTFGAAIPAGANMAGKVVNKTLDKLIVKRVAKRAILEIEKELGKLSSDELKLVKESIDSGGTKDDAISNIKELRLADKEMDMALSFDTPVDVPKVKAITEATEARTSPVETIKPETPVKPPVKELTLKEGTYKSATKDGFMDVKGTSVKIHKDIETFTHKDVNGNWVVSEVNTGKSLNQGGGFPIQKQAIDDARNLVDHYGIDKIKKSIGETPVKPPIKEVGGAKEAIAKGLTEDEWVKGQGTPVYRGEYTRKQELNNSISTSLDRNVAKGFSESGKIREMIVDKNAKIIDISTLRKEILGVDKFPNPSTLTKEQFDSITGNKLIDYAKSKGYDVIDHTKSGIKSSGVKVGKVLDEQEYQILNKDVLKTTSQLRAEYADALKSSKPIKEVPKKTPKVETKTKEIPAPKVKAPKQPKESITAKKMNQRLNGVDELSTKYDVVNLNKEINEASSLIEKNKTKAVETVFSDTGSNTQKVAIATELFEKAVVEGDVKTQSLLFDRIKKLSTETAQALNMFKALTVTNPHFKYMKEVVNLRLDKIKIRGEDITRAMNKKTEPIVASITKATKSRVKIVNAQKLLDKLIC